MYICIRKCVYIYVYYMYREMCVYIEREKEKQCRQQILAAAMPLHHCTARDVRKSPRLRAPNPIVMSQTPEETNGQIMSNHGDLFRGLWALKVCRISKYLEVQKRRAFRTLHVATKLPLMA